jgi:TniQ protein
VPAPTHEAWPLPLVPRPHSGEALSSWVQRIASRYDVGGDDLIRHVLGQDGLWLGRLDRLDACADRELETALADAGQIDVRRIRGLRVVRDDGAARCWHRVRSAWCPACLEHDLARDGEVYGRAYWRLGCTVLCPVHALPLEDRCDRCWTQGRCRFFPSPGRIRLVCATCGCCVDPRSWRAASSGRLETESGFGVRWTPALTALVRRLQDDLQAALAGARPAQQWAGIRTAAGLIRVVRDLVETLIEANGVRAEKQFTWQEIAQGEVRFVAEPITPAALSVGQARDALAIVAALLESAGRRALGDELWCWDGVVRALHLDAFVDHVPAPVRPLILRPRRSRLPVGSASPRPRSTLASTLMARPRQPEPSCSIPAD